ncbi:MAG: alpha/beta hydrolase [Candidatus Kariarchaeaceae archaeon]|jgi:predicted alpha/beta superfamily hydrolase
MYNLKSSSQKYEAQVILLILLLINLSAFSQSSQSAPSNFLRLNSDSLEHETFIFESSIVGRNYSIQIGYPQNYSESDKKYPVIFLLDADWNFDTCSQIMAELMEQGKIPKAVLIGIGYIPMDQLFIYSLRITDFFYPHDPSEPVTGGGENFSKFIQDELIPYLDNNYNIDPSNRTLIGHSAGGYFTLYSLFKYRSSTTSSFKNYIAISPAIGYFNYYLLDMEDEMADSIEGELPLRLFLTAGDPDRDLPNFAENARILKDKLEKREYQEFKLKAKEYQGLDHGAVLEPSIIDGLSWIFNGANTDEIHSTNNSSEIFGISMISFTLIILNRYYKRRIENHH